MAVEHRMHDAILTAEDNLVIPRVEMAVKSITSWTGHGMNSEVQNLDRRYLLGNIRITPLMSASRRLDLDNVLNRNDETPKKVVSEDGDFAALKPNFDGRAHAYHTCPIGKSNFRKRKAKEVKEIFVPKWRLSKTEIFAQKSP